MTGEGLPPSGFDPGMPKHGWVGEILRRFGDGGALPAGYRAYFECFNDGRYYEAHDVLEHVWLGCHDAHATYYKGLIQIAGAFVHLQKNFEYPGHPKHARRLQPAVRLFALGVKNIAPFGPRHLGFDVEAAVTISESFSARIRRSQFSENPWAPSSKPRLPALRAM